LHGSSIEQVTPASAPGHSSTPISNKVITGEIQARIMLILIWQVNLGELLEDPRLHVNFLGEMRYCLFGFKVST
jgi:hypothetical protein